MSTSTTSTRTSATSPRPLQIMASSMNGLSVGDSVADNIMVSPVRLENASCFRDEMITQYSPMSEESDDYRYCDTQVNTNGSQTDAMSSPSTSPISSPHRFQKPHTWFSSANPYPLPSCSLSAVVCAHARRSSGTEHEGRIPSSPNDMCHGGDLRRTALLRSVQMRVQSPHPCDLLSSSGHGQEQEGDHVHADELDHDQKRAVGVQLDQRSFSCPKSIQDAEYQSPTNCGLRSDHDVDFVEDQITV
ncbi:hypothetical protein SETIT_5G160400v2 [Setaria italica]|uniref:Uncharacterized protein n=2 Tax=Setaria TaxID=4554 RepID=A0A368R594_SETIT|nr:uncharacterized protein LOC101772447 isoform X2 [Setaria italica]XP_034593118.1 uncharacterized protein LOC117854962 isoform X2 [Setaria viridis]RCV25361.1 hypothetical protein SETIT_5G160400v2 [Setaria italica]TKW14306.1 hypothetical protein SEVIR_5G159800v2 [Setaria viridis]